MADDRSNLDREDDLEDLGEERKPEADEIGRATGEDIAGADELEDDADEGKDQEIKEG